MRLRVTCAGILIGSADFQLTDALVHAALVPEAGYAFAADEARRLALQFCPTQFWSPIDGDFADVAATRWEGGRLALEDSLGVELGVNNIVVLDFPTRDADPDIRIVADYRPDLARVEAFLRTIGPSDGRRRPAA